MLCVTVAPRYSVRATAAGTPAAHHRLCGFRRIGHSKKEGLCEQAPNAFLFTMACPDSMLEHVFNQYPIPPGTIL